MLLLLASHNPHKKKEMQSILPLPYELKDLNDIEFTEDIEEYGNNLEENALIKARSLHGIINMNCIAEDSGLEIESLNGEPGVHSARFAGHEKNDKNNILLVLKKMNGLINRKAQFRTVIALIMEHREYLFEGIVKGEIALFANGAQGFGYDPIFIPENYNQTFAELGDDIKIKISHRTKAVNKLIAFLETHTPNFK